MSESSPIPNTPRYKDPQFMKDWAERVFWTTVQGALAAVSYDQFDLPLWSVPIVAAGLAALKGFVARAYGNKDSASTVPSV
jgi:hypothetical protein